MRWINRPLPQVGDKKIKECFLFFPRCLPNIEDKDEWRWLEKVKIYMEVKRVDRFVGSPGCGGWWTKRDCWIEMKWAS